MEHAVMGPGFMIGPLSHDVLAFGFLCLAYAVNDLFTATETSLLQGRRAALMICLLSAALAQTGLAVAGLVGFAPPGLAAAGGLVSALLFLALPGFLWPLARRLRAGRLRVLNAELRGRMERAEARASQARAWLELAEAAGHVGHWEYRPEGGRLEWSDEMYRIHGLWREHYRPELASALAAFHPLDGKRLSALLAEAMDHGRKLDVAARLRRPDGETRHVVLRGEARLDGDGNVAALFGVMVDVTETKAAGQRPPLHAGGVEGPAEDLLTGLADRKQFDASLGYEFKRAIRSKKPLGLVMFEIDQYYQYSSHYGARQAEAAFKEVARVVGALPRRTGDVVARYGETEIAVLLPLADEAGALCVASQILEAVRALNLPDAARENGLLSISCGAAATGVDDLYNPLELTRRAARALADARLYGGDRACAWRAERYSDA